MTSIVMQALEDESSENFRKNQLFDWVGADRAFPVENKVFKEKASSFSKIGTNKVWLKSSLV